MKVRHGEGVANHIGPEPCVAVRKDVDEASVGEDIGQPLSHEIDNSWAPTRFRRRKATQPSTKSQGLAARLGRRTWHVSKLLGREPGDPRSGHSRMRWSALGRRGPGKSDSAIVARKPTNKAGQPAAEPVERRAGAEGNAGQQSTCRAQNREGVTQALERIRHVTLQWMERLSSQLGGLASGHPRQEPSARIGPARICAGGAQQ